MRLLGLEPGAWIIILQALATYSALGSAYLILRPVLQGQLVQAHRDVLASLQASDADTRDLVDQAAAALARQAGADQPRAARDNRWGKFLLLASIAMFTGAVVIQITTDPSFRATSGTP